MWPRVNNVPTYGNRTCAEILEFPTNGNIPLLKSQELTQQQTRESITASAPIAMETPQTQTPRACDSRNSHVPIQLLRQSKPDIPLLPSHLCWDDVDCRINHSIHRNSGLEGPREQPGWERGDLGLFCAVSRLGPVFVWHCLDVAIVTFDKSVLWMLWNIKPRQPFREGKSRGIEQGGAGIFKGILVRFSALIRSNKCFAALN